MPEVSVIVPIYNVSKYLRKCIDSILCQTFNDFELILVDDGSTDDSFDICKNYTLVDNRIHVIRQSNAGLSAARNTGIDHSTGHFLTFIDSDDYVEPSYLDFLYKLILESNADVAQCGHYIEFNINKKVEKSTDRATYVFNSHDAMESLCYNGLYDVTAWNKMYRRDLFEEVRFPVGWLYEDTATSYLIVHNANRLVVNMKPLYHYIQRYDSIANGRKFNENKYQFIDVGDQFAGFVSSNYPDLISATNAKRVFVRLSTLSQMINTKHRDIRMEKKIVDVAKKLSFGVLLNKKVHSRDKVGIIALLMGVNVYRIIWSAYYHHIRD
ncbi:glycosyltransferase family 2 protein [Latilactobacillus curvatus]|uniref:glycosyltransferase family 2 protein n=1 Tax=Latilactobacillus curvatus TaxID=28038 RepID=UPI000B60CCD9|nr:glycosyltransferase [Latilactobacillus curvatus]ASN61551.1 glycosyl transferase group 2 [Latilactobacillus curvatus]MCT2880579.1 glycosyltransferase [Latilactobacillus curvatus]